MKYWQVKHNKHEIIIKGDFDDASDVWLQAYKPLLYFKRHSSLA